MLLVKRIYFVIASFICVLIIYKSTDYIFPNFTEGFLSDKKPVYHFYKYFLYLHIIGAPVAFLTGVYQFLVTKSKHHKKTGLVYVVSILLLASPGAFVMSFYAIGGVLGSLSFIIMSILWFYFTLKSYLYIKSKDIKRHESMMVRSFILTNSAIGMRILSYANNQYHFLNIEFRYIIITWLSWLPALLFYELILLRRQQNYSNKLR